MLLSRSPLSSSDTQVLLATLFICAVSWAPHLPLCVAQDIGVNGATLPTLTLNNPTPATQTSSDDSQTDSDNNTTWSGLPADISSRTLEDRIALSEDVLENITTALHASGECARAELHIQYSTQLKEQAAQQCVANSVFLSNLWSKVRNPAEDCAASAPTASCGEDPSSLYAHGLVTYERLRTAVLANDDIFATGGCFGYHEFSLACNLTCIYVRRNVTYESTLKNKSTASLYYRTENLDLSDFPIGEVISGRGEPAFFAGPQKKFNKVPVELRNSVYGFNHFETPSEKQYLMPGQEWDTSVAYQHGYWTRPYYDCDIGGVWMISFMMPIIITDRGASANGSHNARFVGVTGLDIELNKVDINQCPVADDDKDVAFSDALANTHLCPSTTVCQSIPNKGFTSGAYKCVCESRYYPNTAELLALNATYDDGIPGTVIADHMKEVREGRCANMTRNRTLACLVRDIELTFSCKPCHESCDQCRDSSTCLYALNRPLMISMSVINLASIILALGFIVAVSALRNRKEVKAASWPFLITGLVGAILMYCPGLHLPTTSEATLAVRCKADIVLETTGFALLYGSIFIKIWRIQQLISPGFLKKTLVRGQTLDGRSIANRLILLLAATAVFLLIWMLASPPKLIKVPTGDENDPKNYYHCDPGLFNYVAVGVELGLMIWGAYLCQRTRNVAAKFTDSRELVISFYMFIAVVSLAITLEYALLSGKADQHLMLYTLRIQLTVTVTIMIVFIPKLRAVYHSTIFYRRRTFRSRQGRPSQVSMQSFTQADPRLSRHRATRASVLSRNSVSSMVSVPLERRPSRHLASASSASLQKANNANPCHTFLHRNSSLALSTHSTGGSLES